MNKSNQGYKQENEKRIIIVVGDKKKKKTKNGSLNSQN